jgi:hypothetical protein
VQEGALAKEDPGVDVGMNLDLPRYTQNWTTLQEDFRRKSVSSYRASVREDVFWYSIKSVTSCTSMAIWKVQVRKVHWYSTGAPQMQEGGSVSEDAVAEEAPQVDGPQDQPAMFFQEKATQRRRIKKSTPSSFVQLKATPNSQMQLQKVIRDLGRISPKLSALAMEAESKGGDAFENVKKLIQEMIVRLLNEAAEGADQKAW